MEIDASKELFSFAMVVIGSTTRPTSVNKLAVTALQHTTTPSFVTLDMFALVVPYFLFFIRKNDDFIGYHIDAMMTFMPISLY